MMCKFHRSFMLQVGPKMSPKLTLILHCETLITDNNPLIGLLNLPLADSNDV